MLKVQTMPNSKNFFQENEYKICNAFCILYNGKGAMNFLALQIKIGVSGDQKEIVVRSPYFPSDSGTPPPSKEFKELVKYNAKRKLELLTECDTTSHHTVWDSSDVNSKGGGGFM